MSVAFRLDELPLTRFHWRITALVGAASAARAMDASMTALVLASLVSEWSLSPPEVGMVASANQLGMVVGVALLGTLGDRYGRLAMFHVVTFLFSLGSALSGLAWDLGSLTGFRILTSLGLGGNSPITTTIMSEFSPTKHRGRLYLIVQAFWVFGSVLAALIATTVVPHWGWRAMLFIGAIPILLSPVAARTLPESPRYLLSRGKKEEAERTIRRIEAECGVEPVAKATADSPEAVRPERYPRAKFSELWFGYRKRTIYLWSLWFAVTYVYTGIFNFLPPLLLANGFNLEQSFQFTTVMTAAQIPGCITVALIVDKLGRKRTIVTLLTLCSVASFLFGFARSPLEVILWGSAVGFFSIGAWGILSTYAAELYPTHLRSTGVGWAGAVGRTASILAPVLTGFLLRTWSGSYTLAFVISAALALAGAISTLLFGEETGRRSLEEINA